MHPKKSLDWMGERSSDFNSQSPIQIRIDKLEFNDFPSASKPRMRRTRSQQVATAAAGTTPHHCSFLKVQSSTSPAITYSFCGFLIFLISFERPLIIIIFAAALLYNVILSLLTFPSILFLFSSLRLLPSCLSHLLFHNPFFSQRSIISIISNEVEKLKPYRSAFTELSVQNYCNGDAFEGEIYKKKFSGSGVYYCNMNGRYEGEWVEGQCDGYGARTWENGGLYKGSFRHGLHHGYGIHQFPTGEVYAGQWLKGNIHGYGLLIYIDGGKYVGEFKWNLKQGLGLYYFNNGDTYAGEFSNNMMHGYGVYNFADGHKYEGSWHEGTREGLGIFTSINGEAQVGHWHKGFLGFISSYTTLPVSPKTANRLDVLNAAQSAREAAERAFDIPMIDEKVQKAVAAVDAADMAACTARIIALNAVQNSYCLSINKSWCKGAIRIALDSLLHFICAAKGFMINRAPYGWGCRSTFSLV